MIIHNPIFTGSLSLNGTNLSTSNLVTTGSNTFAAPQIINSNLTVTGSITTTTLVVQTITSSIDYVTGSTRFGSLSSNTHVYTGSMSVSGSLNVNSGSFYVGTVGSVIAVGVNTTTPQSQFVVAKTGNSASVEINLNNSGYGRIFAYDRTAGASANLTLNDPGGNVGIGTTNPINGRLEVQTSATTASLWVQTGGTTSAYTIADFRTGTNLSALQILGNGVSSFGSNVGIGTTSPSGILDVQQSNTGNMSISFMNTYGATSSTAQTVDMSFKLVGSGLTGQIGSMIRTGKEGDYSSGGARDAYLAFSTAIDDSLTEKLRISSEGNLLVTSGATIYNTSGNLYMRAGTSGDLILGAGGSNDKLRITSTGQIGVGTTPSAWASPFIAIQGGSYGQHIGFQTNGPDVKIGSNNYYNGSGYIYTTTNGAAQLNIGGNSGFQFNLAGSGGAGTSVTFSTIMAISAGGTVGIGTGSPSANAILHLYTNGSCTQYFDTTAYGGGNAFIMQIKNNPVNGNFYIQDASTGNGVYISKGGTSWTGISSDVRKKKNFETVPGLDAVLQIEPIKYHFVWDEDTREKRLGFKAQNIQPLIPEMVLETGEFAEDGSPYLTVTPDYILPVLVKAIQELKAEIDELKNK